MPTKEYAIPEIHFYPRPPRGGRLTNIQQFNKLSTISIHALREEGDHNTYMVYAR